MPSRKLSEYERKRSFSETPEPKGSKKKAAAKKPSAKKKSGGKKAKPKAKPKAPRFVVQEHHARRLHWDLRLEHDGALASWALPKGVPQDPKKNHLAVRTEDHPLEYLEFHGRIPEGQYGAGTMGIWDSGTYEPEKFRDDEVTATFSGKRVKGKYALFQTKEDNWMIHRMDPPLDPDREPMPEYVRPMKASLVDRLPTDEEKWAYELKWDGVRAIAFCESGRLRLQSRSLRDMTRTYPELRALAEELCSTDAVFDGEIVAFDDEARPSFQRLQPRMHVTSEAAIRRLRESVPVTYVIFDLLHLDGHNLMPLPYEERRERLDGLGLDGPSWQTPRNHVGDGAALVELTKERGLEGVIAKRLDCPYLPGRRGRGWLKLKNVTSQEFVIGGWLPGKGRRESTLGALLVGYYEDGALRYAGRVGTGFSDKELDMLMERLEPLRRETSPFEGRQPPKEAIFTDPELVAQVGFSEWTQARTLRAPRYEGLRDDKAPSEVVFEGARHPDEVPTV